MRASGKKNFFFNLWLSSSRLFRPVNLSRRLAAYGRIRQEVAVVVCVSSAIVVDCCLPSAGLSSLAPWLPPPSPLPWICRLAGGLRRYWKYHVLEIFQEIIHSNPQQPCDKKLSSVSYMYETVFPKTKARNWLSLAAELSSQLAIHEAPCGWRSPGFK